MQPQSKHCMDDHTSKTVLLTWREKKQANDLGADQVHCGKRSGSFRFEAKLRIMGDDRGLQRYAPIAHQLQECEQEELCQKPESSSAIIDAVRGAGQEFFSSKYCKKEILEIVTIRYSTNHELGQPYSGTRQLHGGLDCSQLLVMVSTCSLSLSLWDCRQQEYGWGGGAVLTSFLQAPHSFVFGQCENRLLDYSSIWFDPERPLLEQNISQNRLMIIGPLSRQRSP